MYFCVNSNTTLVKVKFTALCVHQKKYYDSNTTLVKVKYGYKFIVISFPKLFKYNTC